MKRSKKGYEREENVLPPHIHQLKSYFLIEHPKQDLGNRRGQVIQYTLKKL